MDLRNIKVEVQGVVLVVSYSVVVPYSPEYHIHQGILFTNNYGK